METVDDEIRDLAIKFMDKANKDGKPFFVWLNPTRMHIVTHLSEKWEATRNAENGWSEEEAGMASLITTSAGAAEDQGHGRGR
jgi:arylsulfatase